ncbi:MAG: DEAD/DEAH box helicase family protein [Spirochaetes bacterium]|nr:DEAD/DEAH box helicase family protein [Spirochaetota bacterium]
MEMKQYQQEVINDLQAYLTKLEKTRHLKKAFNDYWEDKGISLSLLEDDYLKPYDNSIKNVPRITVKVPTAGGKTFIACNALKPILDSMPKENPKVVAWFVPSDTILKQTYKNLNDPAHPYRQKIDSHFGCAVKVYQKQDLLQGASFSPAIIREQLSIFVLSVQSFSANNKEARKAYQENENLQEFPKIYQQKDKLLPDVDETALMQVITQLNPVVIIDESHNFEADLRIEMLNNINPSFILDLTATPREKSNIISFVDAMKLKINNMVKLPVIVYNHQDSNEVINSAIQLQKTLEAKAKVQEAAGGRYIRPIVLFQAQPKTDKDNITFEKIKKNLIKLGIAENQIKIKTADRDEIKNIDLLSKDCEVRYIITVNALKEGWDCPFAYILASLANKSSPVDVEQILGRILRLPYVTKHQQELLNLAYVFTSSSNFQNTLEKIIAALNKAGFSKKDYRVKEEQIEIEKKESSFEDLFFKKEEENTDPEIDPDIIKGYSESEQGRQKLDDIITMAENTNSDFQQRIEEYKKEDTTVSEVVKEKMKSYPIKDIFVNEVKGLELPAFFKKAAPSMIEKEYFVPLAKSMLLKDFDLSIEDHKIDFTNTGSEMVEVDLQEVRTGEYEPKYQKVSDQVKDEYRKYISSLPPEKQIKELVSRLQRNINLNEVPEIQIKEYIKLAIANLDSEKITEISNNEVYYAQKIKNKINELIVQYSEKQFQNELDKGSIVCRPHFKFPQRIYPKNNTTGIIKNLYVEEGEMNDFEKFIINEIANLETVVFWHRNLERGKGFYINGFINHYPDFILKMKDGMIVLIETKGLDRDGSDSKKKLKLGQAWANKAGSNYRYFMVFTTDKLEGAKNLTELLTILKAMK